MYQVGGSSSPCDVSSWLREVAKPEWGCGRRECSHERSKLEDGCRASVPAQPDGWSGTCMSSLSLTASPGRTPVIEQAGKRSSGVWHRSWGRGHPVLTCSRVTRQVVWECRVSGQHDKGKGECDGAVAGDARVLCMCEGAVVCVTCGCCVGEGAVVCDARVLCE